ncbi:MAG: carboxypeptidase-like regulatory domain-containing protein [Chitinophagaceae bacterium]
MKELLLIICTHCLCCATGIAQNVLTGRVIEAGTPKPVPAATVYVSNSSTGTSTGDNGEFVLKKPMNDKFTLVVSCIGYETFTKDFQQGTIALNMRIELRRKAADLDEVVVTPADKNGWAKWGDLFIEHFMGNSSYARSCRIKNPKVLKFRMNEKDSTLTVVAGEAIVIENKSLGYTVRYNLKEFKYYFSGNTVFYSGYALFEDHAFSDGKLRVQYLEAREKVYAVSLMHFIRSLYTGTTQPAGFVIMRKIKNGTIEMKKGGTVVEQEYTGVSLFDTVYEISNADTRIKIVAVESTEKPNANFDSADKSSINNLISYNDGKLVLNFTDTLQVIYTKDRPPFEYAGNNRAAKVISSELSMPWPGPVTIMPDGSFTPTNLVMNGFWGWWEKISIMLPYDFQPLD